jgi:hypothetical protein
MFDTSQPNVVLDQGDDMYENNYIVRKRLVLRSNKRDLRFPNKLYNQSITPKQ